MTYLSVMPSSRKKGAGTALTMSLQVLAYNMKRVIAILGVRPLMAAIRA